ncbi:hypothetical protein K439DRAFT_1404832 [Ramaria rubella]|nr:hypothetical protein K439DRAFT_1404832 [Ramaria rubella]
MFRRRRSSLLNYHRPNLNGLEQPLKPESIACLRNLSAYKCPKPRGRLPRSRSAAVLVALFVGRGGDLYVLLSRRSDELRSYPGDTSLPGGKLEHKDRSRENAAVFFFFSEFSQNDIKIPFTFQRREAFEEIGLPLDKTKVPLLCILEPFLAGNNTIVTPVVVLILDQTIRVRRIHIDLEYHLSFAQPILNAAEVESLFSHPLLGFLATSPIRDTEPRDGDLSPSDDKEPLLHPSLTKASPYAPKPTERPYHIHSDTRWHGNLVRMHSFSTGREADGIKPIRGLTSAILIRTAQIGYACQPAFELNAPEQPSLAERIAIAIQSEESLRNACREEGIEKDWLTHDEPRKPDRGKRTTVTKGNSVRGRL